MFYFDNFFGKRILKSTLLKDYNIFFTTRDFVLTPSNRLDLIEEADNNRQFLKEKLNAGIITAAKQIHGSNIQIIDNKTECYEDTDALVSDIEGSVMLLNFADCVPVILYSPKDNIGAVVHAGWRGTEAQIAKKASESLQNNFNVKSENIIALIGPSIGKCCFETGVDVFERLVPDKSKTDLYNKTNDKYFIDLKLLNKNQLLDTRVVNIDICDYCTCCMSDIFFSYRKENGVTARHSAVLQIKKGK